MISNNRAIKVSVRPSEELIFLIKSAINQARTFLKTWESIKTKAIAEGLTENQLRPMLPKEWSKDQRYYFFHREEQIERVQSRKFTTDDLIAQKDEEIRILKLKLEDALQNNKIISAEEIAQLQRCEEKKRHLEQDLIEWQKEYVQWSAKKAEIINKWSSDLEIKYSILKRPLNTICIDIFENLKTKHCIDGDAEKILFDNLVVD
jgi:hypothetical protein